MKKLIMALSFSASLLTGFANIALAQEEKAEQVQASALTPATVKAPLQATVDQSKTMQRTYAKPTPSNMQKALLRASALDMTDPAVQDDYILLNECSIFINSYQDDFKLNRLRQAIKRVIEKERSGWPDAFMFVSPLQLGQYDFTAENFPLAEKSQIKNVNSFLLSQSEKDVCLQGKKLTRLPGVVSVRIDQPITVTSLPLNPQQGKDLLNSMLKSNNGGRRIYARFNIAVSFMPAVDHNNPNKSAGERYLLEGTLSSIEFFEDETLTKPIYIFTR